MSFFEQAHFEFKNSIKKLSRQTSKVWLDYRNTGGDIEILIYYQHTHVNDDFSNTYIKNEIILPDVRLYMLTYKQWWSDAIPS